MAKCSRTRSIESTSFLSFGTREAKRRAAGRPEVFALWKEAVVLQLRSNFFRGQKKLTQGSRLKSTNVLCGLCLAKSFEVVPEQTADTAKLIDGFQVGKNQGRSAAEKTLAQLVRNTLAGSISPFPLYGHLSGRNCRIRRRVFVVCGCLVCLPRHQE